MKKLLFLIGLMFLPYAYMQAQGGDSDTLWTKKFPTASGNITQISFTPDSQNVAVASGGSILVFNISNGEFVKRFDTNTESIYSFTLSENGNMLVTSGWNSILTIWNFKTGDTIRTIRPDGTFAHIKIIEPNLLLGLWGGLSDINNIRVWDINTGQTISSKSTKGSPNILDICLQKNLFAINVDNTSHDIQIWDLLTMTYKFSLEQPDNFINDLRFSPDGKYLGTAGNDGYVKIWDVDTRQLKYTLLNDTSGYGAKTICFSPDSKFIISGVSIFDKWNTKVWKVETGELVKVYSPPYGCVNGLDISNDGIFLAGGLGGNFFILKNSWYHTSIPIHNQIEKLLFPNPTGSIINIPIINNGIANSINLINYSGLILKEFKNISSISDYYQIDISSLSTGTYFVNVLYNDNVLSYKFIKTK